MTHAEIRSLYLNGSHCGPITADGLRTSGNFSLQKTTITGEVRFLGADIGGDLSCTGATMDNEGKKALNADGLTVKGSVFLRGDFSCTGEVRFLGADIGGDLDCSKGTFQGEICLLGANIDGVLGCTGATMVNEGGMALNADGLTVKGDVFLSGDFSCTGEVRFLGADLGGDLDCTGATMDNNDGDALSADRLTVKGSVFLSDGFSSTGEVRFLGADIGGDLSCIGATMDNQGEKALSADRLMVKGDVFLSRDFSCKGEVRFPGADIGGNLNCSKGTFHGEVCLLGANIGGVLGCIGATMDNEGGKALSADRLTVKGSVFLRNDFSSTGEVRFPGADIGGDLDCTGATMDNEGGKALNAQDLHVKGSVFIQDFSSPGLLDFTRATVDAYFIVAGVKKREQFGISLISASVGHLRFSKDSWPTQNNLYLDGLTYERLDDTDGVQPHQRIHWVKLQPQQHGRFHPQPYEQLAKSLAKAGHAEEAKDTQYSKAKDNLKYTYLPVRKWLLYQFLGLIIGFGHKPLRALYWIVGAIALGALIFWVAAPGMTESQHWAITPCDSQAEPLHLESYPPFHPLWYSIDSFIPLVDLHMERYWTPNTEVRWPAHGDLYITGELLRWFQWLFILLGWIFTTLFVVGLTGLVRGDPSKE